MVPSERDSASGCLCGPNFIFDLIGESPVFWLNSWQGVGGTFFDKTSGDPQTPIFTSKRHDFEMLAPKIKILVSKFKYLVPTFKYPAKIWR